MKRVILCLLCLLPVAGCCGQKSPPVPCCSTPDHFWEEKRLAAVTEIAGACSDLSQCFFTRAGKKLGKDGEKPTFDRREAAAVRAINKHLPLLGVDFDKRLSLYIQLHRSLSEVCSTDCGTYLEMAAAVENAMDGVYKAALDGSPMPGLPLQAVPFQARIKLTPLGYVTCQYQYWLANKE